MKKNGPYNCSICTSSFKSKETMKIYNLMVHEGKKNAKCSLCETSFFYKDDLIRHVAIVHEGEKPYKCSICEVMFSSIRNLKEHIEAVHEKKKPFKCLSDQCNLGFSQKSKRMSIFYQYIKIRIFKQLLGCHICLLTLIKARNIFCSYLQKG